MKNTFLTFDEIVADMFSKMTVEDKIALKECPTCDLYLYHHTVGRHIRNEYLLWQEGNPLTHTSREDQRSKPDEYIIDGIDYHPTHPDAVSNLIIKELWKKVQ